LAAAAFDSRVSEIGLAKAQAELEKGGIDRLMNQQSMQERLNQSIEKMKEIFISLAEPILGFLEPLVELIQVILPAINLLLKPIIEVFKMLMKIVNSTIKFAVSPFTSKLGNDIISPPGYGQRTLLSPEGTIKLNDNDTLIAGTKLLDNNGLLNNNKEQKINVPSVSTNVNVDLQPLLQEVQAMKNVLNQLLNKETSIYLDGNIVGIAQNTGTNSFTI
jgi:division protein CdvB (Snf7/Vps24/ESCRT-III family)